MKRTITAQTVEEAFAEGQRSVDAPRGETVVTPGGWSRAAELRIAIDQGESQVVQGSPLARSPRKQHSDGAKGSCERIVDPSGLVLVKGRSVQLGEFSGAGPDRHIGLLDVVTAEDGAPMAAGFMSWSRDDSFPWHLDYAEIDLVLEGVLEITIGGRVLQGRAGDVFYIPKGSDIVFGTPSRTRVFYVTYPANWASGGSVPARPQK